MGNSDYDLPVTDQLLHDYAMPTDDSAADIDAMVLSGDCFVTLATHLDAASDNAAQNPIVEQTVRTLIYLQQHYRIVKKSPDYRQ